MKKILTLIVLVLMSSFVISQTMYQDINEQISKGNYSNAQRMIAELVTSGVLSEEEIYELKLQSAILDRIRIDFSRSEDDVIRELKKYFPKLDSQQLMQWEETNDLEMKIIDGEKRYFRNAVPNLFRKNPVAKKARQKREDQSKSSLDLYLESYLPAVVSEAKKTKTAFVLPQTIKITYTLKVNANRIPEGETVRAWLPFPRSDNKRIQNIELLATSEKEYIISPENYTHQSIYMEKKSVKDKPAIFQFSASYTAYNEYNKISSENFTPYDTAGNFFKKYTAERDAHILFTPELRALSAEIVGTEKNPLKKAKLIYKWIGRNIPWTSALEYSTIPNIPLYCIQNRRGDCGIKALLFITLCRYNGIPAKWQSGWYIYPGNLNLHDWAEIYIEGRGWLPIDPDFNDQDIDDEDSREFFFGSADAFRLIINDDFSGEFFPAKIYPRSETVDFQRGEVEWKGGNLYFNDWTYDMNVEYLE